MKKFYVESHFGCTIFEGKTLEATRNRALKEIGTHCFRLIREATQEDIAWVEAMQGGTSSDIVCSECRRVL